MTLDLGELSKSALQFSYHQTLDRVLTDSQLIRLASNPTADPKKFVGDDPRSQFGEVS